MNDLALLLTILGMGAITYAVRLSMFVLLGRVELPDWLRRALRYVPPTVLSAIIFPELFMPGGTLDISLHNFRLLAGLVAVVVAWRTRSILLTLIAGMGVLWLLQALGRP